MDNKLDYKFEYKFTLHNTFDAILWFKEQVKSLRVNTDPNLKKQREKDKKEILSAPKNQIDTFERGKMYLFHYDPKSRKELPYYDTYPLILLTGIHRNGFSGLNLHYIPVEPRMILLSNLIQKSVFKDGELNRLNIKYENLNNVQEFQFFQPCFKQYCTSNIKSTIKLIEPQDWAFAASLPIESFKKKTKKQVWSESMKSLDMTL